ncbi:MAG: nickel pincer cofactor biosynthesis protein LarC [Thermomicrobiales bacterium]|nr:nickel pincer cofactor biosynthesis protein LarC [Thermomicrobiales bacterium]MCO5222612.1 nickel pincer cofactor biosynthesis protein LarC [Thermomicrobiales bacterium]
MTVVLFDPYSGASGDMVLGALVDVGLSLDALREHLCLVLEDGWSISAETVSQHSVHGTRVLVELEDGQPQRDWADIRALIADSSLPDSMKRRAISMFELVAEAEARVHRTPLDRVHFHEVGAVDSIVDICGAAIGFELLGIATAYTLPVRTGQGFVMTSHGLLPVPAPATAEIIARRRLPVAPPGPAGDGVTAELLTPTGAAIIGATATPVASGFKAGRIGYGFGTMELPWPNALRIWLAEDAGTSGPDAGELLLETNIDDMNPQAFELLAERLSAAGALEVWLTPVQMKKGRPGTIVGLLAPAGARAELERVIFENSTSLGVRATRIERTKTGRAFESVATRFGDITLKLKIVDGRVLSAMPEYDDCARLARESDAPFAEIWDEAHRIGERFVGSQITGDRGGDAAEWFARADRAR